MKTKSSVLLVVVMLSLLCLSGCGRLRKQAGVEFYNLRFLSGNNSVVLIVENTATDFWGLAQFHTELVGLGIVDAGETLETSTDDKGTHIKVLDKEGNPTDDYIRVGGNPKAPGGVWRTGSKDEMEPVSAPKYLLGKDGNWYKK